MIKPTPESAAKLQKILSKRIGRELSNEELEEAYDALMGFAIALVELDSNEPKYPIANTNPNVLQYV